MSARPYLVATAAASMHQGQTNIVCHVIEAHSEPAVIESSGILTWHVVRPAKYHSPRHRCAF